MRVTIIKPTVNHQKKKRVCAYARVSTYSLSQGDSLENQIQYYENIISSNPEYEFAGIFADRGISGTTENRPEFQRMLELCRSGNIDLIITKSVSRFARNTAIMLQTVRELKYIGVEVKFEKENIDTLSGNGELMLTILSSFAQKESKNVSDNIKWRFKEKFKRGELVINEKRFLGDAILQKYYTPDHLTKTKVKNNGQVDSYYIEDNHSPIIAREMWEQVQEEIKRRNEAKGNIQGNTDKYKRRYPLTGMLYCSKCGASLIRRTWNSKLNCKKIVWQCSSYIRNGKGACEGTKIDDETVSRLNAKEPVIVKA